MRVLALSTSTVRGSVALVQDDQILGADSYQDLEHAERIFGAVERTFAMASCSPSAPVGFACDIGPGSFTGVRVGVASAKGMALARAAPLAGVVSLQAMAAAAFAQGVACELDVVLAVIDAKKGEVFLAAYASDLRALLTPRHLPRQALPATVQALVERGGPGEGAAQPAPGKLVVTGEVATELPDVAALVVRGPALDLPDAAWIARVAASRLAAGGDFDPASVEPLYVRAPDAKPST
jgi:tRNA threonylcarbamoyladenosine biosynthesis protein TsaB